MTFAARRITTTPLTVSILPGESATAHLITTHTFTTNSATVTGGTGSYTYQWHESDDGNTWTPPGTTQSQAIVVQGVVAQTSTAHYYCVATDIYTGATGTSSVSTYAYTAT